MTKELAALLNCPLKPSIDTLTETKQKKCTPIGCMCWVEDSETKIIDSKILDRGKPAPEGYTYQKAVFTDNRICHVFIKTKQIDRSYCTLRGKDL